MKNAKKLLLLVLSLVVLIGVFTVAALAEETTEAQTATVVYPDGKTQTVNVGQEIPPLSFENDRTTGEDAKLYYGVDNTLYKDDATEGWTFYVRGSVIPLENLTVTEALAGKTIFAKGVDKVYFTTYEKFGSTANMIYHYTDSISTYFTSANKGDVTTGAIPYDDPDPKNSPDSDNYWLKDCSTKRSIGLTIYEDVTAESIPLSLKNFSSNVAVTLNMNLNGHNVVVNSGVANNGFVLYLYSSVPGAHYVVKSGAIFNNNDDATTYLGNNASESYGNNIYFHTQKIFSNGWGNGTYIIGGHFYQLPGATSALLGLKCRTYSARNASFYVQDGCAVFDDAGTGGYQNLGKGTSAVTNCSFYSLGSSAVLNSTGAKLKFENCAFYSVTATNAGNGGTVTLNGDANKTDLKADFKTVTWLDGTTKDFYVAETKEAAMAFVENHPNAKIGLDPYAIENGNKLSYVFDRFADFSYDDSFNATVTVIDGEAVEIAFTYSVSGGELQYVPTIGTADDDGKNFHAILNNLSNVTIKMYSDIVLYNGVLFGTYKEEYKKDAEGNVTATYYFIQTSGNVDWDLNGYKVTVDETAKYLVVQMGSADSYTSFAAMHQLGSSCVFKLYSSVEGGEYINNSANAIFGVTKYGTPSYIIGTNEKNVSGGDNLTVTTKGCIVRGYESNGTSGTYYYINGGAYIYTGTITPFLIGGPNEVHNATIVTNNAAKAIFVNHYFKSANLKVDNLTVVAKNNATKFIASGDNVGISSSTNDVTHKIDVGDVVLIGDGLKTEYNVTSAKNTYTISGKVTTSSEAVFATAYPELAENQKKTYFYADIYDGNYKMIGCYDSSDVVTIQNAKLDTEECWLPGSAYVFDGEITADDKIIQIENVNYYLENAAWVSSIDGEIYEGDICAAENAGKTVVFAIEGDPSPLYFTILFADGTFEPYTGDAAAAKTALETLLSTKATQGYTMKLYSNMVSSKSTGGFALNSNTNANIFRFDLNGFSWTFDTAKDSGQSFTSHSGRFYFYSSVEGAKLIATASKSIMLADTHSYTYFGESDTSGSSYGKNITFEAKKISHSMFYGNSLSIYGGTYILSSDTTTNYIIDARNTGLQALRNATFIMQDASYFTHGLRLSTTVTNCTFISLGKPTQLFKPLGTPGYNYYTNPQTGVKFYTQDQNTTFVNCNFYNIIPNTCEEIDVTYTDCNFSLASTEAQAGGYIAYTNDEFKLTVNGVEYVFTAKLLAADQVGLVDWGFGLTEYWAVGTTAEHKNTIIDGRFGYTFEKIENVAQGEQTAIATLVAIHPGALQMSLTLHSEIGLNLMLTEAALKNAVVTLNGETYTLANLTAVDGIYTITTKIAPNKANEAINLVIVFNGYTHTLPISIGTYAEVILNSGDASHIAAQKLTYAMVEYVRAMTDDSFCSGVSVPDGYKPFELEKPDTIRNSAYSIAFCLDEMITIAISGTEGEKITLKLPSGRVLEANVQSGAALFSDLAVNEISNTFVIVAGGQPIEYSLVDYYFAMEEPVNADVIKALYSYAKYAFEYAKEHR